MSYHRADSTLFFNLSNHTPMTLWCIYCAKILMQGWGCDILTNWCTFYLHTLADFMRNHFDFCHFWQVVGSQARILYSDDKGRVNIAKAFNKAVAEGKLLVRLFKLVCVSFAIKSIRIWLQFFVWKIHISKQTQNCIRI